MPVEVVSTLGRTTRTSAWRRDSAIVLVRFGQQAFVTDVERDGLAYSAHWLT
jgi:hypothetical protein